MLAAAIVVTVSGCAYAPPRDEPAAPVPPLVSASTWRDVHEEIWNASRLAAEESEAYARFAMDEWMDKVRKRTEEAFVPWYLSYWTQQWISVKVAWYESNQEEGEPSASKRLAAYIQKEYESRVLLPVTQESDPREIRDTASEMYVKLVSEQLQGIPNRFDIPSEEFHRRLAAIPAIAIQGDPTHSISLSVLIDSGPVTTRTAYAELVRQIETGGEDRGGGDTTDELHPVAEIAANKLSSTVAVRGGAAAAAAAVGGPVGILISLGALGWGAYTHERDRPALETRLRECLDTASQEIWRYMVEDPRAGVTAPVRHMSAQIESGVWVPYAAPAEGAEPLRGGS